MSQGDYHLEQKGDVLQHKLELLLETLRKEQSFLHETKNDDTNADTIKSDMTSLDEDKEKGQLDKTEKELANLKRRKKGFQENQAVMSRYQNFWSIDTFATKF